MDACQKRSMNFAQVLACFNHKQCSPVSAFQNIMDPATSVENNKHRGEQQTDANANTRVANAPFLQKVQSLILG